MSICLRRLIEFLTQATVLAGVIHANAAEDEKSPPISVSAKMDKVSYMSGEPMQFLMTFQNDSADEIDVSCAFDDGDRYEGTPTMEDVFNASLHGPKGYERSWFQPYYFHYPTISSPAIRLDPRTSENRAFVISRVFRDLSPGKYTLTWRVDTRSRVGDTAVGAQQGEGTPLIAAGKCEFVVTERDQKDLEALADELIAKAESGNSLSLLSTMPSELALPRFKSYIGDLGRISTLTFEDARDSWKHKDGAIPFYGDALHELIFFDNREAVDFLGAVWKRLKADKALRKRGSIAPSIETAVQYALRDMHVSTRKPEVRKAIQEVYIPLFGSSRFLRFRDKEDFENWKKLQSGETFDR